MPQNNCSEILETQDITGNKSKNFLEKLIELDYNVAVKNIEKLKETDAKYADFEAPSLIEVNDEEIEGGEEKLNDLKGNVFQREEEASRGEGPKEWPKVIDNSQPEKAHCVGREINFSNQNSNAAKNFNIMHSQILIVKGMVNGINANVVLDSGSAISIINKKLSIGLEPKQVNNISVQAADQRTLEINSTVLAKINIGGFETEHVFYLLENSNFDVLLGTDYFVKYRPVIDYIDGCVRLISNNEVLITIPMEGVKQIVPNIENKAPPIMVNNETLHSVISNTLTEVLNSLPENLAHSLNSEVRKVICEENNKSNDNENFTKESAGSCESSPVEKSACAEFLSVFPDEYFNEFSHDLACNVVSSEDIVLQPKGYTRIKAKLTRKIENPQCYIKSNYSLYEKVKVLVPNCIVQIASNTCDIYVYNTMREERKIFQNTTLGQLQEYELAMPIEENPERDKFSFLPCNTNVTSSSKEEQLYEARRASYDENSLDIGDSLITDTDELKELLFKYRHLFAWNLRQIGCVKGYEHNIETEPGKVIYQRPYRMSPFEKRVAHELVQELADAGIVSQKSSFTPWNSPLLLVKKSNKEGSEKLSSQYRIVVDFRKLNSITKSPTYFIGHMDDIIDFIKKSQVHSTLDLASGFYQLPLTPESREKTTFTIPGIGAWNFERLPMGASAAPSSFMRFMSAVLNNLGNQVACFIDDILICGENMADHNKKLKALFQQLEKFNLCIQPSKCHFAKSEIRILGYVASREGLKPDPEKVRAIEQLPYPRSLTETRSAIGCFSFYRRYIHRFSDIAAPLTALTRKDVPFHIGDKEKEAFDKLKTALITAPVLAAYDETKPIVIRADASGVGIASILLQRGEDGSLHPIAYASRRLNKNELNYSTSMRELLAIVYSFIKFRHYLYGHSAGKEDGSGITVISDHLSHQFLHTNKRHNHRLCRWAIILDEFKYKIQYTSGLSLRDADYLSRYFPPIEEKREEIAPKNPTPIDELSAFSYNFIKDAPSKEEIPFFYLSSGEELNVDEFIKNQRQDEKLSEIINHLENPEMPCSSIYSRYLANFVLKNGILYKKNSGKGNLHLIVVPKHLTQEFISKYHDDPYSGGHLSFEKVYDKIARRHFWNGMRKEIYLYCRRCADCQSIKKAPKTSLQALHPITTRFPFYHIEIDCLGPLKPSRINKYRYVVLAVDLYSRFVIGRPLRHATALEIARFLLQDIITKYGMFTVISSDRGSSFTSNIIKEFCKLLGIIRVNSTAFSPTTQGLVERNNRTLVDMIKCYINSTHNSWDQFLNELIFAHNTARNASLGISPFRMLHNYEPRLVTDSLLGDITVEERTIQEFQKETELIRDIAKERLEKTQEAMKASFAKKHTFTEYQVGDLVRVYTPTRKNNLQKKKFLKMWHGPYVITKVQSPHAYVVELYDQGTKSNAIRRQLVSIRRLKKVVPPADYDPTPFLQTEPDLNENIETEEEDNE